ncbi:MAG: hypothetical protein ABTQ34_02230 [Bdellovibrionales bacterium]
MREAAINERRATQTWRRFFLIPLLVVVLICAPVAKTWAQAGAVVGGTGAAQRAALIAQATAALACIPASGSLYDFLHYSGVIPVVDCALLNLFASYVLAQALPRIGQWDIRNSSMAYRNSLLSGTQRGIVEAKVRAQQADNNMRVRMNNAVASHESAQKYSYMPGNHLCPLVSATSAIDEVEDGKLAVSQALADTLRWQGIAGENPNAQAAFLGLLCRLNMVDTTLSGALLDKICEQKSTEFRGSIMHANSVVGKIEYTFPSNIKKLKDGRIWLDTPPKDEDMKALSAIMFCASMHAPTGNPVASSSRTPTTSDAYKIALQIRQQALSNVSGNYCMAAVADRIAVPDSVGVDELKRLHKAQALFCTNMKHSGCMSEADYQVCQKDGMSPLNMKRHIACQYSVPTCTTEGLVKRGFDQETVTKMVSQGKDDCGQFHRTLSSNNQRFIEEIRGASAPVGVVESDLTDRQAQ